ncbi:MAG: Uncharacterized protein Greene07147_680 [Parcubacteria group bacterium Greene0714_7]|nr:MAG: Uncharacterized protein Greene07147_680 [Parcubacteria group bacterium Greene0714_7]
MTGNKQGTPIEVMKELLPDPIAKIKLEDFLMGHLKTFLEDVSLENFPLESPNLDKDAFLARLESYEEKTDILQQLITLLAKWGKSPEQLYLLQQILVRISEANQKVAGVIGWAKFQWYPLQLLMYSAGIGALATKNFAALKIILDTPVRRDETPNETHPLSIVVGSKVSEMGDWFKQLPGLEAKKYPRSEHLFVVLQPILENILYLSGNYEELFDEFEVLQALSFANFRGGGWGPQGRFSWKHQRYDAGPFLRMVEEGRVEGKNWGPIKAGMFKGSSEDFLKTAEEFKERLTSW